MTDELRSWWESLTYEDKWEAFVIEKGNADALAAIRAEGLDVERLRTAQGNVWPRLTDGTRRLPVLVDDFAGRVAAEYARLGGER